MDESKNEPVSPTSTKPSMENFTAIALDKFLQNLKTGFFKDFLEQDEAWVPKLGLFALYLSALLGGVAAVVLPVKYKFDWGYCLGIGVAWVIICISVHYITYKFLPVLRHMIKNTPTRLSSTALLDCLALISGVVGLVVLVGGVYYGIKEGSAELIFSSIFFFIFTGYLLSIFLNPRALNVEINEYSSMGEEFLGIISFAMKCILRLIPIMFGLGVALGVVNLVEFIFRDFEYMSEVIAKLLQIAKLLFFAVLPAIDYFVFLGYFFFIDLATAILSIPKRSEKE